VAGTWICPPPLTAGPDTRRRRKRTRTRAPSTTPLWPPKAPKRQRASTGRKLLTAAESKDRDAAVEAAITALRRTVTPVVFPEEPLPYGDLGEYVLVLIAPCPPLSVNETSGRGFGSTLGDKKAWLAAGELAALEHHRELRRFAGHRIDVTIAVPLTNVKLADGANFASAVSLKALVDSLVRSGCLAPDDKSKWMRVDVVFWDGGPRKNEVRVRIRAAEPPWDPSDS